MTQGWHQTEDKLPACPTPSSTLATGSATSTARSSFYEKLGFAETRRMPIGDEAINVFMALRGR